MQPPASHNWHAEYIARADPETGARIVQITSAPMIHEHIAPETPVFTPDSRCVIYSRRQATDLPREYWVADLATLQVRRLTDEPNVKAPVVAPDGGSVYYISEDLDVELKRVSLRTFERETVARTSAICDASDLGTIRFDGRAYVTSGAVRGMRDMWAVVRFDLVGGQARIILQTDQICHAHPQYARGPFRDLLIQENHGCRFDAQGHCLAPTSGYGPDLHVIDDEGGNPRELALGRSDVEMIQGHHCWAGRTPRVLSTLVRRDTPDEAFVSDRIVVTTPGAAGREVVGIGRQFSHPHVSDDARSWVCDEAGTADIFVGSMISHQYELLLHTRSSCGSAQYTHPRPAFSPDASRVVFNSDATGIPQVYVAWVPEPVFARMDASAT